ncbi:hypothetical protein FPV67DRAFT_1574567 [Lyophyllum atratum]|nr:hypothetical protein FPV67DRAFT_1574567 [Lyophyllum atratum]
MAKRKSKAMAEAFKAVQELLSDPSTMTELDRICQSGESISESSAILELLEEVRKTLNKPDYTVENLITEGLSRAKGVQNRRETFLKVKHHYDASQLDGHPAQASHWAKRHIKRALGLSAEPFSVKSMLEAGKTLDSVKIIFRNRAAKTPKLHRFMVEVAGDDEDQLVVNEDTGFYVVPPDESVVFVSRTADGGIEIELAVIRGVATRAAFSGDLYSWLVQVVDNACSERRDVRPDHEGCMVQAGLNLGPRHARVLGWAKSYTKKLDAKTKTEHDEDVIGAVSLLWSLVQTAMPQEVAEHVQKQLDASQLPTVATRNVPKGNGFHLRMGDKVYTFNMAKRAPPEVYMSRGYIAWTHVDPAFCKYAFSFCVGRQILEPTGRKRKATQPLSDGPADGGANFVDASLGVVVKQAKGTIFGFKPEYLHGTTKSYGVLNHAVTITFSRRVADAWLELEAADRIKIESSAGAGEGNVEFEAAKKLKGKSRK